MYYNYEIIEHIFNSMRKNYMKKYFNNIIRNYKFRKCIWKSHYYLLVISIILSILPFTMYKYGYEVKVLTVVNIVAFLFATTLLLYVINKLMNGSKSCDDRTIFINRVLYFKFKLIRIIVYSILLFILTINLIYGLGIRKCEFVSSLTIFLFLLFPIIYIFVVKMRMYVRFKIVEIRDLLNININEIENKYNIKIDDIIRYELDTYEELKGNCDSSFNKEMAKKVLLEIKDIEDNYGRNKNRKR